ncbi:hypothetical protein GCM10017044_26610 [Kordiimonas sediminis]|uniref:Uncharacterized protein n=1 Tax=Kordiimonas sediminis TaxID=1735581 RepID=A0A919AYM2_9PROT|nr:hypothetical protein [Kordiimonas sediminis]GHF29967.1 hypothetical protein GCM10017044_26610 [Kordiimonas sediminis]
MLKVIRPFAALVALTISFGSVALDEDKEMTKAEKRLANILEKYEYTGKEKSCIPLRGLRSQTVIDEKTIFFEAPGGRGYMNKMDNRCPRLVFEERFSFKTSLNQLCSLDIITVLDSFGREWGSCGLGKFEEMKRIPKDKDK